MIATGSARKWPLGLGLAVALAVSPFIASGHAEGLFAGKTIKLMVATPPGGGYDLAARLISRHMRDHLPDRPNIVINNMAGASGITGTNWLYSVAPRDGTTFGTFNKSEAFYQAIGQKGVRFKAEEFSWIGSLSQDPETVNVSDLAGVTSIAEVKTKEVIVGADSGGVMTLYPALLNTTLGTKFKIVTGYAGSAAVYHAVELGEVHGDGGTHWSSWEQTHPQWVKEGKIRALVQVGLKKYATLPNVPLLVDLAENDEQLKLFRFVSASAAVDRPFAAPPGIPADYLAAYRKAFDEAVRDPKFAEDARKANMDFDPRSGADVAQIIAGIVSTPSETVAKVRALIDEGRDKN